MKSLNKILCGCAFATMAASLGVGLGAKSEVSTVKAADYTTTDFYLGRAEVEASGNVYLTFYGENVDNDTWTANLPMDESRLQEFNGLDKISFIINGEETFLRDVYTPNTGAFSKFTRNGCYYFSIDPEYAASFAAANGEGGKFGANEVVVYEGCELPTYAYAGGKTTDTKEGFKSPVRSMVDHKRGNVVVQHYNIIGDIEVNSANVCVDRLNDTGKKSISLGFEHEKYDQLTTQANLQLNGLSDTLSMKEKIAVNGDIYSSLLPAAYEGGVGADNTIYAIGKYWDRGETMLIEMPILSEDIETFDVKKGLIVPVSGGQYDIVESKDGFNLETIQSHTVKAYSVDRDYHFVSNGKVLPKDGGINGRSWAPLHEHKDFNINSVKFRKWSDAGYMLSLFPSEKIAEATGTVSFTNSFRKMYNFDAIEYYAGDEKIDVTYGETFFNLQGTGDFGLRVRNGEDTFGKLGEVTKIIIKKGFEIPNEAFVATGGYESVVEARAGGTSCFALDHDIEIKKWNGQFAVVNHREYDPDNTKEIVPQGIYLRPSDDADSSMVFLQIRLPDDQINYAAAPANDAGAFYPENELANLNLIKKLHIIKIDGSEIDLNYDNILSVRYNQWGDKDLFIQFNKELLPGSELQTIREVVFDEGIEFPDYGTNVRLVSTSKHIYRYVNGSKYALDKQALGFWNASLYETQNRPFTEFNKVCLGEINVKPIGDGDAGLGSQRIWLQPEMDGDGKNIYSEIDNNTNAVCSILFNTNMLGKIVLIKDGVETRMCDLYYGDDCCTVNKWDRPRGTICIAPTLEQGFSYRNYDAIRLEAGLEIPAYGFQSTDASTELGYYVVPTTTTWYLNNKNSYGFQKTATFDETVLNTITGGTVAAPTVPVQDGYIGYWEDASNNLFDPNHIVADNEVYHSYQSEIKVVTPTSLAGVTGAPATSTNVVIGFDDVDYGETTTNVNVADFETFASHIELYDMEGNSLPVNTNHERFIWSNGKLLVQLLDPQSEFLHRIYKIVLKAGAVAPSLAFMTTGEGPTYTIDKDYTYVRFLETDTWSLVNEPTEEISTKVTAAGIGINTNPAGSYNVIIELDNYVEGTTKNSPLMLLDAYDNIHFYKADGSEMELFYNTQQYSSWDGKGVLYQIFSEEAPAKIVLDEGMLIPSAAYIEGEGAMLKLSEEAVLLKVGDGYQFVKEYTFDGESVYFTYGQAPDASKVPTPGTKDSTETTDYTGYWKDSEGNEFDPTALVEKDMTFTTDFNESARKYNVNYVDENGEAVKSVQVANGSEYEVEAGLTKTGYTGYWTSEDVTIEEGKFTMPTKDVTLKAAYTANNYTLTCGDETVDVTFDSAIGELPAVPSVEGKHALGWYIGEEKLEETTVWTFAEDKTAEAKYEDHSYATWTDNGNGTHSSTCECEHVETENHVWGEGVVTTKPTHTTEGVMTYTCTKCGATKTETIPVLIEHDYTDHYIDNEDGLTHEAYCVCDEHTTENHEWDDGEVTTEPTHLSEGVMTYTCEDCGATKTESIAKLPEHTFGGWEKVDENNHQRECACGEVETKPHSWDEGVVTKAQSCTEDGVMTYTCADCGATKTEVIPANGHLWDQGVVTKEATCTEDGVMTYTCDTCHETKTEVIPATGHQLGELIAEVAATTEKEGMKAHYVCSVCGQYFDANKVACTKESLVIAKLPQPTPEPKKGCGGSVIAASAVVTGLAIAGAALIASKKKHD